MSAIVCRSCTAAYSIGAPKCPQCGTPAPASERTGAEAPVVTMACLNQGCSGHDVQRRVPLRVPTPGVLERPTLLCATCWLPLAEVADDPQEKEDEVPKVTVHNGPSIEGVEETGVQLANGDHAVVGEPADETDEGGEQSSPTPEGAGTTSSTSSKKAPTSPETSESAGRSRARTTGSRSKKAQTGPSSAAGTDGDQTAPTSDTDKD
jgi:hypothetical protein